MKVLVAVKRVIDYNVRIRIKPDHSGVETANVKMSMNPFDEIAVEEAVRLKKAGIAQEVVVVTIGNSACQETLRTAFARGADRGILIQTDIEAQPLVVAKLLQQLVAQELPRLVIVGKQAIDNDCNQTGQMLAGLLNWGQGTFISKLICHDDHIEVVREIDGGLETLRLKLPAVVTTDLRLNQPAYLSLPSIMQAKQKSITVIPAETFNIALNAGVKTLWVDAPVFKRAGVKVNSVQELVQKLKHEAKVI